LSRFQSLFSCFSPWILREERESYQKIKEARKLLDFQIIATNNFDFDVYEFGFERGIQWS
jgi:hypothetical protein